MSEPKLKWSREAVIERPDGRIISVFQSDTYAVRAEYPEGIVKVRVLPRGFASKRPDLPDDQDYRRELLTAFEGQYEAVVEEGEDD